jgi:hypothetical protein
MDAVERMIKRERKRKYKLLRKFRQAVDIANRHLNRKYSSSFLFRQIFKWDKYDWIEQHTKNQIAITIYKWCKKNIEYK